MIDKRIQYTSIIPKLVKKMDNVEGPVIKRKTTIKTGFLKSESKDLRTWLSKKEIPIINKRYTAHTNKDKYVVFNSGNIQL